MILKMEIEALSVLRPFIQEELEDVGDNWWNKLVLPHLYPRNQDRAWKLGDRYLNQLDLAEAIRVLKGNWDLIADRYQMDFRYFGLLGHLQCARNSHADASKVSSKKWQHYDRMALNLLATKIKSISRVQ